MSYVFITNCYFQISTILQIKIMGLCRNVAYFSQHLYYLSLLYTKRFQWSAKTSVFVSWRMAERKVQLRGKLERLQFSTSSSFVKIWSACRSEFKAYFWTFWALYHLLFDLETIGVGKMVIWWLINSEKRQKSIMVGGKFEFRS